MSYRDNRSRSSGGRPQNRSGNRGSSSGFGQRRPVELTKVTCSKCGEETEVPFVPDGSRPVYCRDCFQKSKPARY
ncbi:MAG: hypothetical protein KGD64_02990 [Candidatus Heimdallarchaeota archaeon]|nr:hypothetical protein [Candidatus Heimdallarchaeota archaeon]